VPFLRTLYHDDRADHLGGCGNVKVQRLAILGQSEDRRVGERRLEFVKRLLGLDGPGTTRNRPLEHQIFWQHHVFGCNSWLYSNQCINALRYLGVMATKNVGCVC
jgi:hypothetical protein